MADLVERHAAFRALHERPGAFVVRNPWDLGGARILASLGFEARAEREVHRLLEVAPP